jgi:hypothetical protein
MIHLLIEAAFSPGPAGRNSTIVCVVAAAKQTDRGLQIVLICNTWMPDRVGLLLLPDTFLRWDALLFPQVGFPLARP